MSKFNAVPKKESQEVVINKAGGEAYRDSPRMALYKQVATSLWNGDGYYERQADWIARFRANIQEVAKIHPHFLFALAAYARDKEGLALRTSPIALYAEAANCNEVKGTGLIRQYGPRIMLRADEPGEVLGYCKKNFKKIPRGIVRAIADTLPKFDEYQLAKYRKGEFSMRDVLRIARPTPNKPEQSELWKRVVTDELETPETWEVEISKCKTVDEKRAAWNKLLESGKLGVFAILRNMRNISDCGANKNLAASLMTKERVQKSGILPFQWYKAYKALDDKENVLRSAVENAMLFSLDDIEKIPGKTLIACDNSGSMSSITGTRGMENSEIGNLLGAMAVKVCEYAAAGTFGTTFALADIKRKSIFGDLNIINNCGNRTGASTEAWKIFEYMIEKNIVADRVIILSDMQCYSGNGWYSSGSLSSYFDRYKKQVNPNVRLYSINLASQDNTTQFSTKDRVIELAGFSESIFQFITSMEVGENMIDWIMEHYK